MLEKTAADAEFYIVTSADVEQLFLNYTNDLKLDDVRFQQDKAKCHRPRETPTLIHYFSIENRLEGRCLQLLVVLTTKTWSRELSSLISE